MVTDQGQDFVGVRSLTLQFDVNEKKSGTQQNQYQVSEYWQNQVCLGHPQQVPMMQSDHYSTVWFKLLGNKISINISQLQKQLPNIIHILSRWLKIFLCFAKMYIELKRHFYNLFTFRRHLLPLGTQLCIIYIISNQLKAEISVASSCNL